MFSQAKAFGAWGTSVQAWGGKGGVARALIRHIAEGQAERCRGARARAHARREGKRGGRAGQQFDGHELHGVVGVI